MVSEQKLRTKLPGLLVDGSTNGADPLYQQKRYQVGRLQRDNPVKFNGLIATMKIALDELDRAAEAVGFQHVDFDAQGNFIRKTKTR